MPEHIKINNSSYMYISWYQQNHIGYNDYQNNWNTRTFHVALELYQSNIRIKKGVAILLKSQRTKRRILQNDNYTKR